ncbi:MAG: hypothetical protein ABIE55_04420 [Candidatus Aenigmatarchaeota archaeon]
MKGMELPISTIVIIVIVMVVLLAIIAFFFGVWDPGVGGISLESAKNNACQMLISIGCNDPEKIIVNNFDADKDGDLNEGIGNYAPSASACGDSNQNMGDNLLMLCVCWYGVSREECRTNICHCE